MADQDQQILDANESTEKQKIAVCKYCKHEIKANGYIGTTNARRHTEKCDSYIEFVKTNPASHVVYDHDTYVRMFAESIIYHGYALRMVEHIKTRDLHRYLNPYVKDISRYKITKYVMREHDKKDVHSSSRLPLDGKYFHIWCASHILNLIVQTGLQMIDSSVKKLCKVVRFIDSSDARLSAFDKAINDRGDRTFFRGKLVLDVTTRWNSTYNMIRRALDVKEAIDLFILRER
ncbi:putative AC transposase [Bienertia sinuspersici]